MISRRKLLVALGAGALAAPMSSFAQQQGKVWRIGFLEPTPVESHQHLLGAFRQRLRDLGYEEGRNYTIELRFANGKLERLPGLASELVQSKVDVIVAATSPAISAAQKATKTIPIVMSRVGDPVESGFVASFARPGGNITGRTTQAPELMAKRVQLFKEAVPTLASAVVLLDTRNTHEVHGLKQATAAAQKLGIRLQPREVRALEDIEASFSAMVRDRVNGVIVFEGPVTSSHQKRIVDLAAKYLLPGIFPFGDFADSGGLMSFGAAIIDNYRQAAVYVDKILKGAKPSELPVEQPTKFELVINLKTAKALGIKVPQSVLVRADRVIE